MRMACIILLFYPLHVSRRWNNNENDSWGCIWQTPQHVRSRGCMETRKQTQLYLLVLESTIPGVNRPLYPSEETGLPHWTREKFTHFKVGYIQWSSINLSRSTAILGRGTAGFLLHWSVLAEVLCGVSRLSGHSHVFLLFDEPNLTNTVYHSVNQVLFLILDTTTGWILADLRRKAVFPT